MTVIRAIQLKLNEREEPPMKNRKLVVNILAFLALSAMLTAAQMQMPSSEAKPDKSSATPKTLTGIVSDSMCGAHHMAKDKSPAECARMCMKQGMKYALVVGSRVYTLGGHEAELDKLAGEKVTVKGEVTGETVAVQSVILAKKG
jgi:hypothetical protein